MSSVLSELSNIQNPNPIKDRRREIDAPLRSAGLVTALRAWTIVHTDALGALSDGGARTPVVHYWVRTLRAGAGGRGMGWCEDGGGRWVGNEGGER